MAAFYCNSYTTVLSFRHTDSERFRLALRYTEDEGSPHTRRCLTERRGIKVFFP